jgi:ABC-type multidrug transport system fused ATPase/permease subunit
MKEKKQYFKHFIFFYSYVKIKIFIGLLLSILVGLMDGLGLAMFLPLLQMIDGQGVSSSDGMGNLSFITDTIKFLGLELNFLVIMFSILFLFTLKGILRLLEGIYNVKVTQFFITKIRKDSLDVLSDFSYKGFIKSDSGRIQNTLSGEVGKILSAYTNYRSFLQNAITVLVYVVLAFISNPQFAIFVAVGAFISNFIFSSIYKKTKNLSKEITYFGHSYHGLLIQTIAFFKYLKSTGRYESYTNKMRGTIDEIESYNKKMGYINSIVSAAREPIAMIIVIGVIIIQVKVFEQNIATLLLSLLFFQRSMSFIMALQNNWNTFLSFSGSIYNLQDFLSEINSKKEIRGTKKIEKFIGDIIIQDAYFGFIESEPIIKNVNLHLIRNQTFAFVGESGSGKTTLVNILTGLLTINRGKYIIDGVDSKEIDMRTFQNRIGYITQEPVIFDDNVFNNVTFWDEKTPENLHKFWEALRKASILEFIESLPGKENAPLGNNGVMVSGGQKQRLSIARELYKDIDILIMDEATSALDSETERSIQENIDALKGQYTIIIIAHRLSTIKNADQIVLMAKGEISDKGSFSDLISRNLSFKRMVDLQEL